MKPDKHFASAAVILIATTCLIALTWIGAIESIRAERADTLNRANANLANLAQTFSEQINRQILGFDQTLRLMVTAWEANPRGFDLESWRRQTFVLNGISRDMVLTDENGVIRQSSVVEAINQNASALDYFRALSDPSATDNRLYIGPAAIDGIMRMWHMDLARALHFPDGSFAGVIDADYRIAAITDVFGQTQLGADVFLAVVGLDDGKLRGAVSATTIDPDANISDTPMFAAIQGADSGLWTGPSANDAVPRLHAFRRIPDRKLAVVVALSEEEALRPAKYWGRETEVAAGLITMLLGGLALTLIQGTRLARRRRAETAEYRASLAASNAQFEVARALATAKAEQLETTLTGMSDGVSMIDAHLCLVEWNARFPEMAGVPAEILRVGLPMEEILRAQIASRQFGPVEDAETEVARRMMALRAARFGVVRLQRQDGHTLELRRHRVPDGGLVSVYTDVTDHETAEAALRNAQTAVAQANEEKSRFVAIVSHEIRTPLSALLNAIQLLGDSVLAPAQRSLLMIARQASEALAGLIGDVLDVSQMASGRLTIRPSVFQLRPLLDSCVEIVTDQAVARGHSVRVSSAEAAPSTLLADPGRLRQVLLNLLSNALKSSRPVEVWLIAEPGRDAKEAVRLLVTDDGPTIAPEPREGLFDPPVPLDQGGTAASTEPALGLSICRHLMTQMGGNIGYRAWQFENGRQGNAFWLTLPPAALPYGTGNGEQPAPLAMNLPDEPEVAPAHVPRRAVRRSRILLSGDSPAGRVITATMLRREGHYVDAVPDGPTAIEALRGTPYDLVMMDTFMPAIDGKEAAEIIRALPTPAGTTPIIALTANVSLDDEAMAKAAGMDGVLGKPVLLPELREVLRDHVWIPPPGSADAGTSMALATEPPPAAPILSESRINELRATLSAAALVNAVEECLVDMDRRLPALRRSLTAHAPGAISAHAQAMVGMAAVYGMTALESRLRLIVTAAREGELAALGPTIVADLDSDYDQTAKSLRDMLRTEMV
jgi:signal transduction histidine kinase/DNA-binding NarL/FixJ family response regulator